MAAGVHACDPCRQAVIGSCGAEPRRCVTRPHDVSGIPTPRAQRWREWTSPSDCVPNVRAQIKHGQLHCRSCAPSAASSRMVETARRGRVAAQSPEAQASRAETQRRNALAQHAWQPSEQPAWLDENIYLREIQPRLGAVTLLTLSSTLGVLDVLRR